GVVPEAMASAMARGSATIATVRPAMKSCLRSAAPYPSRRTVTSLGVNGRHQAALMNCNIRPMKARQGWRNVGIGAEYSAFAEQNTMERMAFRLFGGNFPGFFRLSSSGEEGGPPHEVPQ